MFFTLPQTTDFFRLRFSWLILLLVTLLPAYGQKAIPPATNELVNDFADLLNRQEEQALTAKLEKIHSEHLPPPSK